MSEFEHIKAEVESIDEAGVSIIDTSPPVEAKDLYRLVGRLDTTGFEYAHVHDHKWTGTTKDREAQYLISVLFHALNSPEGEAIRAKAEAEVVEYLGKEGQQ